MKKTYMIPALYVQRVQAEQMIAASIRNVGGNSGIQINDGEAPEQADAKGNFFGDAAWE